MPGVSIPRGSPRHHLAADRARTSQSCNKLWHRNYVTWFKQPLRLEHATHLAQHWELDMLGKTNDEIIKMVLARGLADGYIQAARGRDARGQGA